jgi:hypothetical protein
MTNRITVDVEGIDDASIVADIEAAILASFHQAVVPGAWRVVVKQSGVSGRWDLTVYGFDVRHTLSISVPPSLLSTLIPRRLKESLNRFIVSQVDDNANRPRLVRAV